MLSHAIPQLIHRMRQQKRASGLLLVMVWLLLSTQMAIANHGCDLSSFTRSITASHTLSQDVVHKSAMHGSQHGGHMAQDVPQQTADPLCEKHCVPDPLQKEDASSLFAVLPTQTELIVADVQTRRINDQQYWSPPIVGPPTEIVFCRFRE